MSALFSAKIRLQQWPFPPLLRYSETRSFIYKVAGKGHPSLYRFSFGSWPIYSTLLPPRSYPGVPQRSFPLALCVRWPRAGFLQAAGGHSRDPTWTKGEIYLLYKQRPRRDNRWVKCGAYFVTLGLVVATHCHYSSYVRRRRQPLREFNACRSAFATKGLNTFPTARRLRRPATRLTPIKLLLWRHWRQVPTKTAVS